MVCFRICVDWWIGLVVGLVWWLRYRGYVLGLLGLSYWLCGLIDMFCLRVLGLS